MYSDLILYHYRNPKNKKKLKNASVCFKMNNPLCGDDISMYVDIRNGNIVDLSFDGTGCAISIAVSSLLTEYAKRKSISKIQNLDSSFIQDLIGVQLSPNRLKCALLPLEVLQKALLSYDRSKTQGSK